MIDTSLISKAEWTWTAAWAIDESPCDTAASEWTGCRVRELMSAGRADDSAEIAKLTGVLEQRLERDRIGEVVR